MLYSSLVSCADQQGFKGFFFVYLLWVNWVFPIFFSSSSCIVHPPVCIVLLLGAGFRFLWDVNCNYFYGLSITLRRRVTSSSRQWPDGPDMTYWFCERDTTDEYYLFASCLGDVGSG